MNDQNSQNAPNQEDGKSLGSSPSPSEKKLQDIWVEETRILSFLEDGAEGKSTTSYKKLSDKIDEYFFKLGYTNAQIVGILVQLLAVGKVQVVFNTHTDRLETLDKNENITRHEAVLLFERYLEKEKGIYNADFDQKATQKIIIQRAG